MRKMNFEELNELIKGKKTDALRNSIISQVLANPGIGCKLMIESAKFVESKYPQIFVMHKELSVRFEMDKSK